MQGVRVGIDRKANALLEYTVLILIVVGALSGANMYLKRSIQSKIKHESDTYLGHGQGLEWASSVSIAKISSNSQRRENFGDQIDISTSSQTRQFSGQAPVPSIKGWSLMEHKGSSIASQDAASAPPTPSYPGLSYIEWHDAGWPEHRGT